MEEHTTEDNKCPVRPYIQGYFGWIAGLAPDDNPYQFLSDDYRDWLQGWKLGNSGLVPDI